MHLFLGEVPSDASCLSNPFWVRISLPSVLLGSDNHSWISYTCACLWKLSSKGEWTLCSSEVGTYCKMQLVVFYFFNVFWDARMDLVISSQCKFKQGAIFPKAFWAKTTSGWDIDSFFVHIPEERVWSLGALVWRGSSVWAPFLARGRRVYHLPSFLLWAGIRAPGPCMPGSHDLPVL